MKVNDNCTKCAYGRFTFAFTDEHIVLVCQACNHSININKDVETFMIEQSIFNDNIKQFFSSIRV